MSEDLNKLYDSHISTDVTANLVMSVLRQRLQAAEERAEKLEGALKYATGALKSLRPVLTVPAAEYVPAIPDAWAIIDDAIAEIENGR